MDYIKFIDKYEKRDEDGYETIVPISSIDSIAKKNNDEEILITITTVSSDFFECVLEKDLSIEQFIKRHIHKL